MPGILDLLPFLKGWEYNTRVFDADVGAPAVSVQPGAETRPVEELGSGWVLHASATANYPFASAGLVLNHKDSGYRTADFRDNFWNLIMEKRRTQPSLSDIWVPRYATQFYAASFISGAAAPLNGVTQRGPNVFVAPGSVVTIRYAMPNLNPTPGASIRISSPNLLGGSLATVRFWSLLYGDVLQIDGVTNLNQLYFRGLLTVDAVDGFEIAWESLDLTAASSSAAQAISPQYGMEFSPSSPVPYHAGFFLSLANPSTLPTSAVQPQVLSVLPSNQLIMTSPPGIIDETNATNAIFSKYEVKYIAVRDQAAFLASLKALGI